MFKASKKLIVICIVAFLLNACGLNEKYENAGYKTPEQAITAYANYFARNDIDGMLSTFAIESFAENNSVESHIEWSGIFAVNNSVYFSSFGKSDYAKKLVAIRRYSELSQNITTMYLHLMNLGSEYDITRILPLKDFESPRDLLNKTFPFSLNEITSQIKVLECISPNKLNEKYDSEVNRNNLKKIKNRYNADDYTSVAIGLRICGYKFILTGDAIKYNDKWHMCILSGNIGSLMGIPSYRSGLHGPLDDDELIISYH